MPRQRPAISLPHALTSSAEFQELTSREREQFEARFERVTMIVEQVETWLSGRGESLKEFVDTLELDLAVTQNLPNPSNADERQTSYLIHSSWTFETTVAGMQHALSPEVSKALDNPVPSLTCSLSEFKRWLQEGARAIRLSLDLFSGAQTFSEVLGAYIARCGRVFAADRAPPQQTRA